MHSLILLWTIGMGQQPVGPDPLQRPPKAHEIGYVSTAEIKAKHESELEHLIKFPKLVRGNPRKKTLALTFDDGPHSDYTPRLLEILKR